MISLKELITSLENVYQCKITVKTILDDDLNEIEYKLYDMNGYCLARINNQKGRIVDKR